MNLFSNVFKRVTLFPRYLGYLYDLRRIRNRLIQRDYEYGYVPSDYVYPPEPKAFLLFQFLPFYFIGKHQCYKHFYGKGNINPYEEFTTKKLSVNIT